MTRHHLILFCSIAYANSFSISNTNSVVRNQQHSKHVIITTSSSSSNSSSSSSSNVRGVSTRQRASIVDVDDEADIDIEQNDEDVVSPSAAVSALEGVGRGGGLSSKSKLEEKEVGVWPCLDELDRKLIKLAVPSIANFAINPLIGAVDLFWVGRMGNALALAGMAAANQVFNSAFWLFSFLPTITAPLVSKAHARGDQEEVQDLICQAMMLGVFVSAGMSALMISKPEMFLSAVLEPGAPAVEFAKPYLMVRALSFLPAMVATVGFSAFRGILEPTTPLRISAGANAANAILDPILVFRGGLGVTGAALATAMAEVISFGAYMWLMLKKQMISIPKLLQLPKWKLLKPLLLGGIAVQLRNVALNVTFLSVTRATQGLDQTGVAAAAHSIAIQVFQIGGIFLLGLATVAAALVPMEIETKGKRAAKNLSNRLMAWGCILGSVLGLVQIAVIPAVKAFSPLPEVQEAAKIPSIIASILQIINGMVFIGEGIMAGTQSFLTLSVSTVIATVGMLHALKIWTAKYGLPGVWMSFGVFNGLRLLGVLFHQRLSGPLATRQLRKDEAEPKNQ